MKEIRVNTRNRTHSLDIAREVADAVKASGADSASLPWFLPRFARAFASSLN